MRRLSLFLGLLLWSVACGTGAAAPVPPTAHSAIESEWQRWLTKSAEAASGNFWFRPERAGYRSFLSRLRREAGMTPPGWWSKAIGTAWVGRNGNLTSPETAPNRYYDAVVNWKDSNGQGFGSVINLPREGILRISGSTLILSNRRQFLIFPCYSGELFPSWEGQLDAVWSGDRIFLANHSMTGEGLKVCCIHSQTGRVLWSNQFDGYGGASGSGRWHHNLLLHARGGKLWVWGAGSVCAGVWRLDAQTGATQFSFFTPNWRSSSLSSETSNGYTPMLT